MKTALHLDEERVHAYADSLLEQAALEREQMFNIMAGAILGASTLATIIMGAAATEQDHDKARMAAVGMLKDAQQRLKDMSPAMAKEMQQQYTTWAAMPMAVPSKLVH